MSTLKNSPSQRVKAYAITHPSTTAPATQHLRFALGQSWYSFTSNPSCKNQRVPSLMDCGERSRSNGARKTLPSNGQVMSQRNASHA